MVMAAPMISAVTRFLRGVSGDSANTQTSPMISRNGNAISFVVPAKPKSTAVNQKGARTRHATVNARIRNAAAISPNVECEYQSSGLVIVTSTPATASALDVFFLSVQ